jgi:hypothetical protein
MKPSYTTSLFIGAIAGLMMGVVFATYATATGGVGSLTAEIVGADVVPTIAPAASAMWITVIIAGLIGGFILAVATKAIASVIEPDAATASVTVIGAVGAVVGATVAVVVVPLGITVLGSITNGLAVIGVADLFVLAAVTGLVAGACVVWLSYVLARKPQEAQDPDLMAA